MIKLLLNLSSVLILSSTLFAQSTAVTATITDSDGQTWNNGSYIVTFVPTPGKPGPYTCNGVPVNANPINGTLSNTGVLSGLTVTDNSCIVPAGSSWNFVVCPNASSGCSNVNIPVQGASVDLTTSLNAAIPVVRIESKNQAYGYLDSEVTGKINPGGQYWNVTTGCLRLYNGTTFTCAQSGTMGVSSFNTRTGAVVSIAGDYNFTQISGTITAGQVGFPFVSSFNTRTGAVVASFGDYGFNLISGNISTTQMNSGAGASTSTFWRGDGTWAGVGASGVSSFNTRTGAVVSAANDYNFNQLAGNIAVGQMNNGAGAGVNSFWRGDGQWGIPANTGVTSFNSRTGAVVPATNDYGFSNLSGNIAIGQIAGGSGASSTTFLRGDNTWQVPSTTAVTILNSSTSTQGKFAAFTTGATCTTANTDSASCPSTFTVPGSPFAGSFIITCSGGAAASGVPHLETVGQTGTNQFIVIVMNNGASAGAQVSGYSSVGCIAWGN